MPTNITDVDAFTDPATRPVDGDLGNGATFQNPFQALANRTRFIANQLGGILGTGEWTYRAGGKTRTFLVPLWPSTGVWTVATDMSAAGGLRLESGSPGDIQTIPLNPYIKHGYAIDNIRLLCTPGGAQAADANKIQIQLWSTTPNIGTPASPTPAAIGTPAYDDGTANPQIVQLTYGPSIGVVTEGNNVARYYFLKLRAGLDPAGFAYALQLTCLVPGPRDV